jgi:signal transduction histidine kinase
MRLPLSVHARIGLLAVVTIAAALLFGMTAIDTIVEGVVADNVDVKMDTQVRVLQRAVDAAGRLDEPALRPFAELAEPPAGWGWKVITPAGAWDKGVQPGTIEYPLPRVHPIDGVYSGRGTSTLGGAIRVRRLDPQPGRVAATILVASPRELIDREIARVRIELQYVFAQVAAVVVLATVLQLHLGLGPLRQLVRQIARVRVGEVLAVPERQPPELRPIAQEINALVVRNDAALEAARMNAANLAHSLKTPLASLLLELDHHDANDDGNDNARMLVQQISERVAHHLSRARSAAIGLGTRARCDAVPVAAELAAVLALAPRREPVLIDNRITRPCPVAVDSHDLAEMLGNLLENACRHAAGRVVMSAEPAGATVRLSVEDDGPGIPEERLAEVIRPGVRLDEGADGGADVSSAGHGLGLTLVKEMASLYGGLLELSRSPLGGLAARLILPREPGAV